jgi:hypothetical protein
MHLTPVVMAPAWGSTAGCAASGDWEEYHVADEHKRISDLFLNNLQKMVNFLLNFCRLDETPGFFDIGKQGVYCIYC